MWKTYTNIGTISRSVGRIEEWSKLEKEGMILTRHQRYKQGNRRSAYGLTFPGSDAFENEKRTHRTLKKQLHPESSSILQHRICNDPSEKMKEGFRQVSGEEKMICTWSTYMLSTQLKAVNQKPEERCHGNQSSGSNGSMRIIINDVGRISRITKSIISERWRALNETTPGFTLPASIWNVLSVY